MTYCRGATKDMTHAVIVTPDHGKIITSMISLNSATGHARPKELLRQIKNADEIIYISDNIQDGPSGYSRPPSGARGSTLNTQLHPSGSSIIEDSRRGGKDVAGGKGEGNAFPPLVASAASQSAECISNYMTHKANSVTLIL